MSQTLAILIIIFCIAVFARWYIGEHANYQKKERDRFDKQFWIFGLIFISGFFAPSYLLFTLIVFSVLLFFATKSPIASFSLYLFLIPLMPMLGHLLLLPALPSFYMTWPRLITMILLLPILFGTVKRRPLIDNSTDLFVLLFFCLVGILAFREATLTGAIRTIAYNTIDLIIPYYIASRLLTTRRVLYIALTSLAGGLFFAAIINIAESFLHWHFFMEVSRNLTGDIGSRYDYRMGFLKAFGAMDRPSQAAFSMALGLGVFWAVSPGFNGKRFSTPFIVATFTAGLLLTFSRSSWLAAAALGFFYTLSQGAKNKLNRIVVVSLPVFIVLFATPFGDKVVSVLPFIGDEQSEAAGTVDYRSELLFTALEVSLDSPLFGNPNYGDDPRLDALRQPSGLLDLVNHYVLLILTTGYLSLFLFLGMLGTAILRALKTSKNNSLDEEQRHYARVLAFSTTSLMLSIAATSATGKIGIFFTCLVGFCVAVSKLEAVKLVDGSEIENSESGQKLT